MRGYWGHVYREVCKLTSIRRELGPLMDIQLISRHEHAALAYILPNVNIIATTPLFRKLTTALTINNSHALRNGQTAWPN